MAWVNALTKPTVGYDLLRHVGIINVFSQDTSFQGIAQTRDSMC